MANKGTSTGTSEGVAPPRIHATEEEARAFDLEPHLTSLYMHEPFFSSIMRTVSKHRTEAVPTAGVLAKDGDINMWWNPRFLAALVSKQVRGLLKHECFHLVLYHTTSRRMDPHVVHNWASDLAINGMIPEEELPPGGLIPGKAFEPLTPEQEAKMGPEAVARYQRLSDKIASFEKGWSTEEYFSRLQDVADDIQKQGEGKSLTQALKDGDVKIDENGNLVDKDGNPVTIVPGGSMDDHDGWGELDESEREYLKGKVQQALRDAVEEADRAGARGWGSVPAEMRKQLRASLRRDIDWRSVLRQFCGLSLRANRDSNVKRLNRKYPAIHPGVQRGYTSHIAVYIDQSGSVSDADLELVFANLKNATRRTEFTLFNFDTQVDVKSERVWRRGSNPGVGRTRCGGTNFEAPTKHANKNAHRFDGYLVITDGEAPKPAHSRLRRGWVIVPDRELIFTPDRRDFVIKVKRKKENAR